MDPRIYRQCDLPVMEGDRSVPGLGLFLEADLVSARKAVPIIGGEKEVETPKLTLPGAAPNPSAKLATTGATPKPSAKLATTGATPKAEAGLVGPSGSPVSAPKPEVFQGSTLKPKIEGAAAPKLGGGLVAPGSQPNPNAKLIVPGTVGTSGSLSQTPYDKPMQSDAKLVDPQGLEVSSRLTEGPGAAKPTPNLAMPGAESKGTSGSLVKPTGVTGGKQETAGAQMLRQEASAAEQSKKDAASSEADLAGRIEQAKTDAQAVKDKVGASAAKIADRKSGISAADPQLTSSAKHLWS